MRNCPGCGPDESPLAEDGQVHTRRTRLHLAKKAHSSDDVADGPPSSGDIYMPAPWKRGIPLRCSRSWRDRVPLLSQPFREQMPARLPYDFGAPWCTIPQAEVRRTGIVLRQVPKPNDMLPHAGHGPRECAGLVSKRLWFLGGLLRRIRKGNGDVTAHKLKIKSVKLCAVSHQPRALPLLGIDLRPRQLRRRDPHVHSTVMVKA